MKFTAVPPSLPKIRTDLLALGLEKGKTLSRLGREIDKRLGGRLSQIIQKEKFHGTAGEVRLVDTWGKMGAGVILLVGLGAPKEPDTDLLRKMAAGAVRAGKKIKAKKISVEDPVQATKIISANMRGQAVAEGALLADYNFVTYKSEKEKEVEKTVSEVEVLSTEAADLQRGFKRGALFAEATNFARDLINTPAKDMTPRRMAEEARKIGRLPHLSVKVYDKGQIERMGMGCYLAVARGSDQPPYFVHLHYRPPRSSGKSRRVVALVGKGVTFDSGGLSLKTASSMETMKDDMSGAAAMLAVMKALSALKFPVEVHGISAVTENMPSGGSGKPGDIAKSMQGKTVEILNTDAEGRLTLADAIHYALRQKPDVVIDLATLTGACVMALGELCSGIMGNNQDLTNRLIEAGKSAGERIWQLPLIEEYKEDLKSSIADLKNVGGRWGGAINGGLFLQEFVDPKIPWAHVDIAGPSWTEKELAYCPRGGTGHAVRTLLHYLISI